jgi:acyl-CoA thioesterase FadM
LRLKEIRNSAFVIEHRITHEEETRLQVVHSLVFVSLKNIKPVPIPDDLRQRMLDYLIVDEPRERE